MGFNLLRKINILSLALKIGLYYIVQQQQNYEQHLKQIPFFMTTFQDFDRINEAHYLIDQHKDPYSMEHIFQKPIEVFLFYWTREIPGFKLFLYLITDLIIAEVISSTYFVHSRSNGQKMQSEKYKITYQYKAVEQIERDQQIIRLVYLFNPLIIIGILVHWTGIFEIGFALLAVYSVHNKKCPILLAGFCYGYALYLNPINLMILPAIFITLDYKNGQSKAYIYKLFFIVLVTLCSAFYVSFLLTGSWLFVKESYLKAYHVNLYEPTIGMIWALFSGMFNRYQLFYHSMFAAIPLTLIYPIYKIISKGIRKFNWEAEQNGLLGYTCSIGLFTGYLYFSFITVFELTVFAILFYSAYQYAFRVQVLIVFNYTAVFMGGLTSCLTTLWLYGLTGNPNFCFFQTTVMYVFVIASFTESVKEFAKGHPIQFDEQKQESVKEKLDSGDKKTIVKQEEELNTQN